jgi:hypothetical protein
MSKIVWVSPNNNYNGGDGTYNNPYGPMNSDSSNSVSKNYGISSGDEIRIQGKKIIDMLEKTHTDVKIHFGNYYMYYELNSEPKNQSTFFYIVELDIVVMISKDNKYNASGIGYVYHNNLSNYRNTEMVFFKKIVDHINTNGNSFTLKELTQTQYNMSRSYCSFINSKDNVSNITVSDNWISETERSTTIGEAITLYNQTSTGKDTYQYILQKFNNSILNLQNTVILPGGRATRSQRLKINYNNNSVLNLKQLGKLDTGSYDSHVQFYDNSNAVFNIDYIYTNNRYDENLYFAQINVSNNFALNIGHLFLSNCRLNMYISQNIQINLKVENMIRYGSSKAEMIDMRKVIDSTVNLELGKINTISSSPEGAGNIHLDMMLSNKTLDNIKQKGLYVKFLEDFEYNLFYTSASFGPYVMRNKLKKDLKICNNIISSGNNDIDIGNFIDTSEVLDTNYKDFELPDDISIKCDLSSKDVYNIVNHFNTQISTLYTPLMINILSENKNLNIKYDIISTVNNATHTLPMILKYENFEKLLLLSQNIYYSSDNNCYHNIAEVKENKFLYKTISPSMSIKPMVMNNYKYYGEYSNALKLDNVFHFKKIIEVEYNGEYNINLSCMMQNIVSNSHKFKITLRYNQYETIEYEYFQKELINGWKDITFNFISNSNQSINIDFEFTLDSKSTELIVSDLATLKLN